LAECAICGGVGVKVDLDRLVELRGASGEACLFGEGPGGLLVAAPPEALDALGAAGRDGGVDAIAIGRVGGDRIEVSAAESGVSLSLERAERAWRSLRPD
jgi:AIR synthase related protein, C-terminal domain